MLTFIEAFGHAVLALTACACDGGKSLTSPCCKAKRALEAIKTCATPTKDDLMQVQAVIAALHNEVVG